MFVTQRRRKIMEVEHLAQIFQDNVRMKNYKCAENNLMQLSNHFQVIMSNPNNVNIINFLREGLIYLLKSGVDLLTHEFSDCLYTIFEGLKRNMCSQSPHRFSFVLFLRNFNLFSRIQRLEYCAPFLFETGRRDYALLWLREVTGGLSDVMVGLSYFLDAHKYECFIETTRASLVYLTLEMKLCIKNNYEINFNETEHFLLKVCEWDVFRDDREYYQCFIVLYKFINMLMETDEGEFEILVEEMFDDVLSLRAQRIARCILYDMHATLAQYLRITKKLILRRLTKRGIEALLILIEGILKPLLKSNYIKFCSNQGCRQELRATGGIHELHDLSLFALAIYKTGLQQGILTDENAQQIMRVYSFAMQHVSRLTCEYAIKIRKKSYQKIADLKELCTTQDLFLCVHSFVLDMIKAERDKSIQIFQQDLFRFLFNLAADFNHPELTASIGLFMVFLYHNNNVVLLQLIRNFGNKLVSALRQLNLSITPLDYAANKRLLPYLGLNFEQNFDMGEVLEFFKTLLNDCNDPAASKLIHRTNVQLQGGGNTCQWP